MIGMNVDSKIRILGKIFGQVPQDEKKKEDSELSLRELKIIIVRIKCINSFYFAIHKISLPAAFCLAIRFCRS